MICSSVNFDRFIVRSFKMGRTLASDGGVIWVTAPDQKITYDGAIVVVAAESSIVNADEV